jgi:hypothetical protein
VTPDDPVDETAALEHRERLAERQSADTERRRQLRLGWETIAGLVFPVGDTALDGGGDLHVERTVATRHHGRAGHLRHRCNLSGQQPGNRPLAAGAPASGSGSPPAGVAA